MDITAQIERINSLVEDINASFRLLNLLIDRFPLDTWSVKFNDEYDWMGPTECALQWSRESSSRSDEYPFCDAIARLEKQSNRLNDFIWERIDLE